jgi:hypothetical protein
MYTALGPNVQELRANVWLTIRCSRHWGARAGSQQGKNSIFTGKTLKGKEVHIVAGVRVKYRDGSLVD